MRIPLAAVTAILLTWTAPGLAQTPPPPKPPDDQGQPARVTFDPVPTANAQACFGLWDACNAPAANGFWFRTEYLAWWFKSGPVPPLMTAESNQAYANDAGTGQTPLVLGNPNAFVVLGGTDVGTGLHQGARFTAGGWINDTQTIGIEGNYFLLANRGKSQQFSTSGNPTLGTPFVDAVTGVESVRIFAGLDELPGNGTLTVTNRLQGAELNVLGNLMSKSTARLDLVGGVRWVNMHEDLNFTTTALLPFGPLPFPPGLSPGQLLNRHDDFSGARNHFYGAQVGIHTDYHWGRFFVDATGKIALGDIHETVVIDGHAVQGDFTKAPLPPAIIYQGLHGGNFAQPTNIGIYDSDRFAIVPELMLNVGYQIAPWASFFVGYDILYMSHVARAGNAIDRTVNKTRTVYSMAVGDPPVGPVRPVFPVPDSQFGLPQNDFWAQGLNFGLEFKF